jgi:hypothetical protein
MSIEFLDGLAATVGAMDNRDTFSRMTQQESGSRQFDKHGKTIISPKGAVGLAQVMPKTGPEAARLAGLPWDENRLYHDPEYNRALGQAYFNEQRRVFGNDEMAAAAYNAGPGAMRHALRVGGPTGWRNHLVGETTDYLGSVFGGGHVAQRNYPESGASPVPVTDIRSAQPSAAESRAMGTPREFDIVDPFTVGSQLGTQNQEVQRRASAADTMLQDVTTQIQAIQPQREAELAQSVGAKQAVGDQIEAETQHLIDKATPIFQRRQAIADRMVEVEQMSPFKRAIKGLFNPNYNPDYLRGQDQILQGALSTMGENYHMITGLQDRLTQVIESRHEATDSIWRLKLDNLNEDTRLGIQAFGMSQQVLGAEMQGLQNQSELLSAQATARVDTMNALSPAQVNAALEQAKQSGGVAIVNGVPLRLGELQNLQVNWADKDLSLQSHITALQSGNLELANAHEDRLISHMNPAEINQAIRNGGMYNGVRLNQEKLTQALAGAQNQQDLQVRNEVIQSAPAQMQEAMSHIVTLTRGTTARMMSLMGSLPPEQQTYMQGLASELHGLGAQINDANAKGFGARFIAEQMPRVQALIQQQQQIAEKVITRWAGNNKNLRAVGQAWISGQPVAGDAAIRGMIEMARTGLPAGTSLRGPALETFRAVQGIVQAEDAPKSGMSIENLMNRGPQSKEEKERSLIQRVQQVVAGRYNNNTMESALHALPEIARQIRGADGKLHPFSRVRSEDFQGAIQAGDDEGYRRIATDLGLANGDQAKQLFAEGPSGALWGQVKSKKGLDDAKLSAAGRTLQAYQTQAMLQALDSSPSATHDFQPSRYLADLMSNPQFQNRVGQLSQLQMNGSFGDYLASTAAGGGFQEVFDHYSKGIQQAFITQHAANMQAVTQRIGNMRGDDPYRRAGMVLAAIPNLNEAEERQLLGAVRQTMGSRPPEDLATRLARGFGTNSAAEYNQAGRDNDYTHIRDVIINQKFADPRLEAIRRRAAAGWSDMESTVERVRRAAR